MLPVIHTKTLHAEAFNKQQTTPTPLRRITSGKSAGKTRSTFQNVVQEKKAAVNSNIHPKVSGLLSARSDLPDRSGNSRKADTGIWSAILDEGLQVAFRGPQSLLDAAEQSLGRVNRIFTPLPQGFPPGACSVLTEGEKVGTLQFYR